LSLAAIAAVGFVLLALGYWTLLVPEGWLTVLAIISVAASLLLVFVTWNIQLVFSVIINAAILYWVLVLAPQ
jgi:hypothetical protein